MKPQVRNPKNQRQQEEEPPHHKIQPSNSNSESESEEGESEAEEEPHNSNSESESEEGESEAEEEPQHVAPTPVESSSSKKRVASEVGGSAGKKPQVRNPMNQAAGRKPPHHKIQSLTPKPPHHKIQYLTPKPAPAKSQSSNSNSKSESEEGESEAEEEPQHVAPTPVKSSSSKKRVASEVGGSAGKKSKFIRRVWSDADEVAVLEGMIEYKAEKGSDPGKNIISFYDFISGKLHSEFSLSQLKDKIKYLRKKFHKQSKNGGDKKTFSVAHHQTLYLLSKRFWVAGEAEVIARPKNKVNFDQISVGVDNVQEFVMEKGLVFLGDEKRAEMQAKWKSLQLDELKFFAGTLELSAGSPEMLPRRQELLARRQELLKEHTYLLIEALED